MNAGRWRGLARALACIGVTLVGVARAEELERQPAQVETITVRGRAEQREILGRQPVELEVVSAERIRALPASDAAAVMGKLPGIRVQQRAQGEEAAVSIEGMPPTYTRILVDGQRYTGELGGVADLADLPLTDAERIELLRGPQALQYGSDAGGGVINLVTRAAPREPGARLELDSRLGGEGFIYGSQVSAGRWGPLGATLRATHDQSDGFEPRGSGAVIVAPGESARKRTEDAYATLEYDLAETARLRSNLGWRFEREDIADAGTRRDHQRWLGTLGLTTRLGHETDWKTDLVFFRGDTESSAGREFAMLEDEWRLTSALSHAFAGLGLNHSLTAGADLLVPALDLDESGLEGLGDAPVLGASHTRESFSELGLFLQWQIGWRERATLQLGARSQLHSEFEDRVVPQVALVLQPASALSVRLGYGTNYHTPSLRDLYQPPVAQLGGAYFLAGNPALRPESSTGLRASLEWAPRPQLRASIAGFWNSIDDHIRSQLAGDIQIGQTLLPPLSGPDSLICRLDPGNERCQPMVSPALRNLFAKSNVDRVRTRGLELQVWLQPHPRVDLRLGYTFLLTRMRSQSLSGLDELPNEPPHTVDVEAAFEIPPWDTRLVARARWRDSAIAEGSGTGLASFADPRQRTDPSLVIDLRLLQPLGERLALFLDVENASDEESVDSYEIRGRRLMVGVRMEMERRGW
jgi:outer membrane receptor for ferrienterochelin and colicins